MLPRKVVPSFASVPAKERAGDGRAAVGHPLILASAQPSRGALPRSERARRLAGSGAPVRQLRSHNWMSPLMVFRCMCPVPSPRVPCSLLPGVYLPLRSALTSKQSLMSPLKLETS